MTTLLLILEMLSYLVTIIGLPVAVYTLWNENHKERINERCEIEQRDEEMYIELSKQYAEFLELLLQYPGLDLLTKNDTPKILTKDQEQQKTVLFEILISLFERAFILLYEPNLDHAGSRRWQSWADYMKWWFDRSDFCQHLENILEGEDPDFAVYMRNLLHANKR